MGDTARRLPTAQRHARNAWPAMLLLAGAAPLVAEDLTLHLPGSGSWTRAVVEYQCDAQAAHLGLPAGPFTVEYVNGADNSLAIVPVSGKPRIFVNVWSASGARYVAGEFLWWDAAGRITLFQSETPAGRVQATCRRTRTH